MKKYLKIYLSLLQILTIVCLYSCKDSLGLDVAVKTKLNDDKSHIIWQLPDSIKSDLTQTGSIRQNFNPYSIDYHPSISASCIFGTESGQLKLGINMNGNPDTIRYNSTMVYISSFILNIDYIPFNIIPNSNSNSKDIVSSYNLDSVNSNGFAQLTVNSLTAGKSSQNTIYCDSSNPLYFQIVTHDTLNIRELKINFYWKIFSSNFQLPTNLSSFNGAIVLYFKKS
ncbi:MAG: hypothetical protein NT007_09145 [Candidatus Kapabacteria bacterium]|nr:hypothetical protein [Candidatus Kapabacteria bacterium]